MPWNRVSIQNLITADRYAPETDEDPAAWIAARPRAYGRPERRRAVADILARHPGTTFNPATLMLERAPVWVDPHSGEEVPAPPQPEPSDEPDAADDELAAPEPAPAPIDPDAPVLRDPGHIFPIASALPGWEWIDHEGVRHPITHDAATDEIVSEAQHTVEVVDISEEIAQRQGEERERSLLPPQHRRDMMLLHIADHLANGTPLPRWVGRLAAETKAAIAERRQQ